MHKDGADCFWWLDIIDPISSNITYMECPERQGAWGGFISTLLLCLCGTEAEYHLCRYTVIEIDPFVCCAHTIILTLHVHSGSEHLEVFT